MTQDATRAWLNTLQATLQYGKTIAPRGFQTYELPQVTIHVDMRRPVVTVPERKLSYQFMAAEAYWILSGDDRVDGIAPFNPKISEFSDDQVTFFGAYGPKIQAQLSYVVRKLKEDPTTRQAGLTIWRENPPPTKDVPCTVALWFFIREGRLNCHAFMRSSDVWLGLPYDIFNFSMVAHLVCCQLNNQTPWIFPGTLYLTAASSHLYAKNFDAACDIVRDPWPQKEQPDALEILAGDEKTLMWTLEVLRRAKAGDTVRWWDREVYR